jgi:PAS domain S-box-containing protein
MHIGIRRILRSALPPAVIAAWLVACAWLIWSIYNQVQAATSAQVAAQQMTLAQQAARGIEGHFANLLSDLRLLAGDERIAQWSAAGARELERYFHANAGEAQSITRMGPDGTIIYTFPNRESTGSAIAGQAHVQKLMATHAAVLSDVFTSVQGYRSIALHVPVLRGGTFDGSVAILIPFDIVAERFLAGVGIGRSGYAWVISRDGTVLYGPAARQIGTNVFAASGASPAELAMVRDMLKGHSGTVVIPRDHARGKAVTAQAAYMPISLVDNFWSIAVEAPENEILSLMTGFLKRWIPTILLLVAGVAGTLAYAFRQAVAARERKARETAEARYRSLVEHLPAINYIVEFGRENRTTYISPQVESILGFSPREWLADRDLWIRQVHPDDRERVAAEVHTSDDRGVPAELEYRALTRDGSVRWIHNRSVFLRDRAGRLTGSHGVMLDITEKKAAERAIRDRDEKLQQAQKLEAVGRLAGGVAHDFNNLLTVIRGYAEFIRNSPDMPLPARADVEEILKAAHRAHSLTNQLLAYSRRQMRTPQVLNINAQVRNMEGMLQRLIGEHILLRTELAPNLASVRADPNQVEQVIMNLAVNARDSMPDGGTLTLATANVSLSSEPDSSSPDMPPGVYVLLAVSDTGKGMGEETLAHIFEPFYTTKETGKGTGLGLSTVYGIVTQSGGHIAAQSAPGEGARFEIHLPCVLEEARVPEEPAARARDPGGTGRILLVEDEDMVRNLARSILSRAGYTVLEARNGREALEAIGAFPGAVDLLLTDVIMPEMGGVELGRRVAALFPGIALIYVSGYSEDSLGSQGVLEKGINFLRKPFSASELLSKIKEVRAE